jgi:hypothetical protein
MIRAHPCKIRGMVLFGLLRDSVSGVHGKPGFSFLGDTSMVGFDSYTSRYLKQLTR